ncbi:MAG: TIGR03936 family radical SAM-associated protein, partial [Dehalococcoidia bacterium]
MKVQRLRVTFTRGDEMKYITHLDLMRFWERALRRAAIPVAYSEGFTPHAQIALAAPLPVGTTSAGELMDVFLSERIPPRRFLADASKQLPAGVTVVSAEEIGLALPAVQADLRFAEYDVDVPGADEGDARAKAERFLAADTFPWEHKREDEVRAYDIRALVDRIDLAARTGDSAIRLHLRLRSDNTGAGRPEQVVAALGLPPP